MFRVQALVLGLGLRLGVHLGVKLSDLRRAFAGASVGFEGLGGEGLTLRILRYELRLPG